MERSRLLKHPCRIVHRALFRRPSSLHKKLSRVLLLVSFTIIALFFLVIVLSTKQQLEFVITKRAGDLGSIVSHSIATPMWDLNIKLIEDMLSPLLADENFAGVLIVDDEGSEVFSAGEVTQSNQVVLVERPIVYMQKGAPRRIGSLTIAMSLGAIHHHFRKSLFTTLLIFAVITVVLPLFTKTLLTPITAPIEKISRAMREYAAGNRSVTIPEVSANDEIGDLANAFASMIKDLDGFHRTMENKVEERTSELLEAKRQVENASAAKTQFLAVVSHELRTPLNGISSLAHLLRLSPLAPSQQQDVAGIESCSRSLLQMVDEILDFAHLSEGNIKLQQEPFFLPGLLRKVAERAEYAAAEKDQVFILHLEKRLPEIVVGDCLRIEQLLLHLLRNAVKFSAKGAGVILMARATKDGADSHLLHLVVVDTGKGITAEKQKAIFDPFKQLQDSETREAGGIGIGLSTCRRLVSLMDGEIWLKSRENIGSAFHFTLPVRVPSTSTLENRI